MHDPSHVDGPLVILMFKVNVRLNLDDRCLDLEFIDMQYDRFTPEGVTDQLELWEFYTMMVADAFRASSIHTPLLSIATQFREGSGGGGENSESHIAKVVTSRRLPSLDIRHYSSKPFFSVAALPWYKLLPEVFFKYLFYFCFFYMPNA